MLSAESSNQIEIKDEMELLMRMNLPRKTGASVAYIEKADTAF